MKKGKTKKIMIGCAVGVLIIAGGFVGYQVFANSAKDQFTETPVTIGNIVNDNRFSGVIESQSREDIMASSALEISEFYVSEGEIIAEETDLYAPVSGDIVTATVAGKLPRFIMMKMILWQPVGKLWKLSILPTCRSVSRWMNINWPA